MNQAVDPISLLANLPYQPVDPPNSSFPIGLIGCGGITGDHLTAYRNAGYHVVALCDIDRSKADARRKEFFPDAKVFDDYDQLLKMDSIAIVDIATHTAIRPPIIEAAIDAEKHVLSQKPFVLDLDVGKALIERADRKGVKLAVNQNGRWAPHFSYARQAVAHGALGKLLSANLTVHWDHTWVEGTAFESMQHLILYDYAIHWFDIVSCFFDQRSANRVFATAKQTSTQTIKPPLLAQVAIEYAEGAASLFFNAETRYGSEDRMYLSGSQASLESHGPNEKEQQLCVTTTSGKYSPRLVGSWFPDGFHGTMAELMSSIAENRTPTIDAERNLRSLELCFAAVASADQGIPIQPGTIRSI